MRSRFISPHAVKVANEILEWANTYLMTENPNIKRPNGSQVVCPFVKSSIENNSFYMSFHPEVNGQDEKHIEEMVEFGKLPPHKDVDPFKKALLVVFDSLPEKDTRILDIVHANVKNHFVQHGLMVGQFHQNCGEPGIYNSGFKVSTCTHSSP